jgi:hypothetical protein
MYKYYHNIFSTNKQNLDAQTRDRGGSAVPLSGLWGVGRDHPLSNVCLLMATLILDGSFGFSGLNMETVMFLFHKAGIYLQVHTALQPRDQHQLSRSVRTSNLTFCFRHQCKVDTSGITCRFVLSLQSGYQRKQGVGCKRKTDRRFL